MKRLRNAFSLALAMCVLLGALPAGAASAAGIIPGDVDLDGSVTAADARLILRASVGLEFLY